MLLHTVFSKRHLLAFAFGSTLLIVGSVGQAAEAPLIAAASDLKFVIDELAAQYQKETGKSVRLVYGSSGNFRRQIAESAPFELFFSADEEFVRDLAKEGWTLGQGTLYAIGRIVIMVPKASLMKPEGDLTDLARAVEAGRIKKFAIANPEHAPYGRAAKEALTKAGLWTKLRERLVIGENVSQAAQFSTSGSTDGGIVAYSLALASAVSQTGRYALIPDTWHSPLKQKMVLLQKAGDTAKDFYRYVQTPRARAAFKKYGFTLPGE